MTDYTDEFVAESTENLTALENALLTLESDPGDDEAMDAVFRSAHTLKGNAGAMGFDGLAGVAHALEDLLDAVRRGETTVTAERMDLVFAAVDEIDAGIDRLRNGDSPDVEATALEADLRATIDEDGDTDDTSESDAEPAGVAPAETVEDEAGEHTEGGAASDGDPSDENAGSDAGGDAEGDADRVVCASVRTAGGPMPGADALLVLEAATRVFDLVASEPSRPDLESGGYADGFDLYFDGADPTRATNYLGAVSAVEAVDVATVDVVPASAVPVEDGAGEPLPVVGAEPAPAADVDDPLEALLADVDDGGNAAAEPDVAIDDGESHGTNDDHMDETAPASAENGDTEADVSPASTGRVADDAVDVNVRSVDVDVDAISTAADNSDRDRADSGDDPVDTRGAGDDDGPVESSASGTPETTDTAQNGSGGASATGVETAPGTPASGGDESNEADDTRSAPSRSTGGAESVESVRVDVERLDDLHGLVEQLVTSRIKLRRAVDTSEGGAARETLNELDKITDELQNTVMDVRLIPLSKVTGRFPRMMRDLARETGKEVDFTMTGTDVELDRRVLTEVSDPLMHVLRNAVDHGLETPAARERAGKPPEGAVELSAEQERDHVIVEVSDDGRGLDVDRIREKALETGVRSAAELDAMTDEETYDLVFHPGFSTTEEVTDLSGRGVGMDVVHETVSGLDGTVSVESEPGEGTTVRLRLPVTVAIVQVLFVEVGARQFGVPIKNIDEVSRSRDLHTVKEQPVVEHGDSLYPVLPLASALDTPGGADAAADEGMLLRIRPEKRRVALHCDRVVDQEEVVVKPLEGVLAGTTGVSGTAVLGDGDVVPILDVVTL